MKKFLALVLMMIALPVLAEEPTKPQPIKIGDISSYTAGGSFALPTRRGFELAQEWINKEGGVLGRPLEVISKDDLGDAADAIKVAERMVFEDKVDVLTGCNLANIELAISSFARQNKVLYVSACTNADTFFWRDGHRYAFRGAGPTLTTINGIMAEKAALHGKIRWAAINPNYEWGQSNLAAFKAALARYQPDAQWIEEQWPAIGKLDGAMLQAVAAKKPDAIYTSLWGSDLFQLIREGQARGLLRKDVLVVCDDIARQENLDTLKAEMPEGWISVSMPSEKSGVAKLDEFQSRFHEKYKDDKLRWTAAMAYQTLYTLKQAYEQAGSTDPEKMADVLGNNFTVADSVFGPFRIRASDHAPTIGIWVGETAVVDGEARFVNWEYKDGTPYLPPEKTREQ